MAAETIISAESHVFEPINLWETRIERRYRQRAPRFIADYQGQPGTWLAYEGVAPRSVASIAAVGIPKEQLVKFQAAITRKAIDLLMSRLSWSDHRISSPRNPIEA